MSMFNITGKVINCFSQEQKPDKETGEVLPAKDKVQIMGSVPVMGGESKFEMVDLSVPDGLSFKEYEGKKVSVPLGVFAPSKGSVIYFIPQGSKISVLQ
jgi:hypothetical protein